MEKQVKTRQRVTDHGEVFTSEREVEAMCDLVKQETERIDSRFLEPACGDGNFLAVILKRKLEVVKKKYRRSAYDWERNSLLALGSVYGIDILPDNVLACRERLFEIWDKEYRAVCKRECSDETRKSARFILQLNIVCGNALTLLCVDGDGKELNAPIIFSEWTFPFNDARMQRKDYTLAGLLAPNDENEKDARRSLFGTDGPDGEGKFLQQYIEHYRRIFKDDAQGNIRFKPLNHTWRAGKCIYCGAAQSEYDREDILEPYAYELLHTPDAEEIYNMRFDVIIGNPPYQLSDGGNGKSAKPIYQLFVERAKKLNPRYLSMIIPSRWFSGGKGLDDFRKAMLSDRRLRKLVDYENFKDVFPGVDLAGGACYFLWERDYEGMCEVVNYSKDNPSSMMRYLDENETFIRQNLAVEIVKKIQSQNTQFLNSRVSARKPFGLPTNYPPKDKGIPCWFIQRIGLKYACTADVEDPHGYLGKWKLLVPKAPIAGQTDFTKPVGFYYDGNTRIAKPGECCTESWIVAGAFDSEAEVLAYKSYIFTKTVRFLLLQTVVSQDVTKKNFGFVPDLGRYEGGYSDEMLCEKWGISDDEWAYIDSRIGTVGGRKGALDRPRQSIFAAAANGHADLPHS